MKTCTAMCSIIFRLHWQNQKQHWPILKEPLYCCRGHPFPLRGRDWGLESAWSYMGTASLQPQHSSALPPETWPALLLCWAGSAATETWGYTTDPVLKPILLLQENKPLPVIFLTGFQNTLFLSSPCQCLRIIGLTLLSSQQPFMWVSIAALSSFLTEHHPHTGTACFTTSLISTAEGPPAHCPLQAASLKPVPGVCPMAELPLTPFGAHRSNLSNTASLPLLKNTSVYHMPQIWHIVQGIIKHGGRRRLLAFPVFLIVSKKKKKKDLAQPAALPAWLLSPHIPSLIPLLILLFLSPEDVLFQLPRPLVVMKKSKTWKSQCASLMQIALSSVGCCPAITQARQIWGLGKKGWCDKWKNSFYHFSTLVLASGWTAFPLQVEYTHHSERLTQ